MAATHVALYDSAGHVHEVFDLTVVGSWSNSATYDTDGFLEFATSGKAVLGLDAVALSAVALTSPTFVNADAQEMQGYGIHDVNDVVTPTDFAARVDGGAWEDPTPDAP